MDTRDLPEDLVSRKYVALLDWCILRPQGLFKNTFNSINIVGLCETVYPDRRNALSFVGLWEDRKEGKRGWTRTALERKSHGPAVDGAHYSVGQGVTFGASQINESANVSGRTDLHHQNFVIQALVALVRYVSVRKAECGTELFQEPVCVVLQVDTVGRHREDALRIRRSRRLRGRAAAMWTTTSTIRIHGESQCSQHANSEDIAPSRRKEEHLEFGARISDEWYKDFEGRSSWRVQAALSMATLYASVRSAM